MASFGAQQNAQIAGQPPAPVPPNTRPPTVNNGQNINPYDPYDTRVGNGGLPQGIQGTADRAYTSEVQGNQLTSQQLQGLLANGGEYLNQATRQAARDANARGILNSSIAVGNARGAAIRAALPIAQADAQAYNDTVRQNVGVLNDRANVNTQAGAQVTAANAAAGASMYGADQSLINQREGRAFEGEQNELGRYFQNQQQANQYGYGLGLQNNQGGWTAGLQNNQFQNGLRQSAFDAAVASNASSQNYYQGAAIAAMNNPFIISNPQNFANYLSYTQGPFVNSINDYLNFALGGGY